MKEKNKNFNSSKLSKKYYYDMEVGKEFESKLSDISEEELVEVSSYYDKTKLELKDKKNNMNKKKRK